MKPSDLVAKAQTAFGQFLGKDDVVFEALKDVLLETELSLEPSYTFTSFSQSLSGQASFVLDRGFGIKTAAFGGGPMLKVDFESIQDLGSRNASGYMFAEQFDPASFSLTVLFGTPLTGTCTGIYIKATDLDTDSSVDFSQLDPYQNLLWYALGKRLAAYVKDKERLEYFSALYTKEGGR